MGIQIRLVVSTDLLLMLDKANSTCKPIKLDCLQCNKHSFNCFPDSTFVLSIINCRSSFNPKQPYEKRKKISLVIFFVIY